MKKILIVSVALALVFTSCKTKKETLETTKQKKEIVTEEVKKQAPEESKVLETKEAVESVAQNVEEKKLSIEKIVLNEINWLTFEEAITAQKKKPKKIMMDAYTNWCGPCKLLDEKTFQKADVAEYVNEHYYAVKFNAEGNETINFRDRTYTNPGYDATKPNRRNASHQLSRYFRIQAYPTILFLDEKADVLTPLRGYYTPAQLEIYLKLFATNDFLNVKTAEEWQAYQDKFVSTFKER